MLLQIYARFFRLFKAALLLTHAEAHAAPLLPPAVATPSSIEPASAGDAEATLLGDAYRGSGVLVGVTGALIVFCAIAPVALTLQGATALAFGVAEVLLMALVIAVLLNVGGLKQRWIDARGRSEEERYRPVRLSLEQAGDLHSATTRLLGGDDCQIRYNLQKHEQYHHMEEVANRLSLIGFGVSLLAALTHLVLHSSWLIFFTASLPALVGALHGINAFLQLGQLSEEHKQMAERLGEMRDYLGRAWEAGDLAEAREIAVSLHELLTTHHTHWRGVADRIHVRAP